MRLWRCRGIFCRLQRNLSKKRHHENVVDVLESRGLLDNISDKNALRKASESCIKVYCGFDPTADALHIGNYLGLVVLRWFQSCGHQVYALVGGATARIGDPSGKSVERPRLSADALQKNTLRIHESIERILGTEATVLNNEEWFKSLSFVDFLSQIGCHARVGAMLNREAVRSRLRSDEGISFSEFSYQLLQAYDFSYLRDHYGVTVQIGGSDQLGNMQAGQEMARKLNPDGGHLYTLTFPLLMSADGRKFGKTEKGALWIDKSKLNSYALYQRLLSVPDDDARSFLRLLTSIPLEQIETLERGVQDGTVNASQLQQLLAENIVRDVHGSKELHRAQTVTNIVKPGVNIGEPVTAQDLLAVAEVLPSVELERSRIIGMPVQTLISKLKLQKKADLRRLIAEGNVFINNCRIVDAGRAKVEEHHILDNKAMLITAGKKRKGVVRIKSASLDSTEIFEQVS
eukprot:Plantae.Rhodophyta-Purpureofilum_apyrenoidigerum.ctg8628.p1 GENE.Plantae.Rhodophyta-Purpureofilum_apyrenoidigerum.ctg8628~~Plantae.Rhodophyta-Purpureofilum_apyrenoidigerum.ctg8628.p1  ORF type:complete len:460 (+),score=56.79 Plantae.Rhodophyta-Purpureofilum_apyrenoidigerum.ctg8628:203-1582(+)